MCLFQWHLVVAVLHVQDTPDLEFALALKDLPNPGKGVAVHHSGIIQASEVHHKPVFTGLFLGDRKGGAAPRPLAWLNLPILQELVSESDPSSTTLSHHLVGPLLDWKCSWVKNDFCLSILSSSGRDP